MAANGYMRFRVSDIDPDLIARLVKHIQKGSTPLGAARLEGIPARRFREWRATGREQLDLAYQTGVYGDAIEREALLELAVEHATALEEQKLGRQLKKGEGEWRAAQAWLQAQARDDFAPTEQVDITVGGREGAPIAVEGRAVVGIGDVIRLFRETGQGHLLGLGDEPAGAAGGELSAARPLLSRVANGQPAAGDVSADTD